MSHPCAQRVAAGAWIAILALTGGFQYYRDAPVDATIFCLLAALLLADQFGAFRRIPLPAAPMPSSSPSVACSCCS